MTEINSIILNGTAYSIGGTGDGLTSEIKQALLDIADHVAWGQDVPTGETYIENLRSALNPPEDLLSISANYTGGSVREGTSLEALRPNLTVTANYTGGSSEVVTNYVLSGSLTEGTSIITVSYGGKTTTFSVTVTSGIPTEYQRVEYIEATGTQYIATGVGGNDDTQKFEIRYYKESQATKAMDLIYGKNPTALKAMYEIGFSTTANRLYAYSSTSAEIIDSAVYGNVNDLTVEFKPSSPYVKMTLKTGQTTLTGEKATANDNIANSMVGVFGYGSAALATARIYSLKAYNSSGLFLNLLPCYRVSDGEIGMYDLVSAQFFTNNGTGVFEKGANV